jgi:CRISPR/Cas system endoribonuclease Cas6 (RAMP superfamily)
MRKGTVLAVLLVLAVAVGAAAAVLTRNSKSPLEKRSIFSFKLSPHGHCFLFKIRYNMYHNYNAYRKKNLVHVEFRRSISLWGRPDRQLERSTLT